MRLGFKRLCGSFAAAALMGGGCAHFTPAERFPNGLDASPGVLERMPAPRSNLNAWDRMRSIDALPYEFAFVSPARPPGHIVAVQIESAYREFQGLMLNGQYTASRISDRHAQAAASIINTTADQISDRDIEVLCLETPGSLDNWIENLYHPDTCALYTNAHVVTLSMGYQLYGPQEYVYSPGTIDYLPEVYAADQFWNASPTIMVQSAGNNGNNVYAQLERPAAEHFMRADTYMTIGEAMRDTDGNPYIVSWSSRSAPTMVTINPFSEGYAYPYIMDEAALRHKLRVAFGTTVPGERRTVGEIFDQRVIAYVRELVSSHAGAPMMSPDNPFSSAHPQFSSASFEGKELLTGDAMAILKDLPAVREAFANALVAAANSQRTQMKGDANGLITNIPGTSFSAPHAGGMMAGAIELYPDLGTYDIMAGAMIAAEPIAERTILGLGFRGAMMRVNQNIGYYDNGRGLPYNTMDAGFGLLEQDKLIATLGEIRNLRARNPALCSDERVVMTGPVNNFVICDDSNPGVACDTREYRFEVHEDILVMRTKLAIGFDGGPAQAPAEILLVNPYGGVTPLCPTKMHNSDFNAVSLASTNGHFGNYSAGTWRLIVPENCRVNMIDMVINGMPRDGLIDAYLQEIIPCAPQKIPLAEPHPFQPPQDGGFLAFAF